MNMPRLRTAEIRFDPEMAAIRIGLFVIAPALLWSGLFRLVALI